MSIIPPLDVLLRVPLLPVLAVMGLRVRRNTLVLPEAVGPRSGELGQGPALRLLILGDSSAAGVGVDELDNALSGHVLCALSEGYCVHWRLIAKTGATSKSALGMLRAEPRSSYDVVVTALGVNDAVRLLPLKIWHRRQAELRTVLRREFGARSILVTAVPPIGNFPALPRLLQWILGAHASRMDARLAEDLQAEPDAVHLTFDLPFTPDLMARDGYHPNASFNALWGQAVAHHILSFRDA